MVSADEHEDGPTGHNALKEADTLDPLPHSELLYNAWAEEEHDPFVGPVISDWLQYAPTESLKSAPTSRYLGGQGGDFICDFSDLNNEEVFDFDAYVGQAEHTANQVRPVSVNNAYHGNYYGTTSLHDNAKAQFGDTYQTTIIATTTSSSSSSCMALAANLVGGAAGGFAFAAANTYYSNDASRKNQTASCSEDKVRATASVGPEKTALPMVSRGILFEGTKITPTSRQDPTSTFEWDPTPLPPPEGIVQAPTGRMNGNIGIASMGSASSQLQSQKTLTKQTLQMLAKKRSYAVAQCSYAATPVPKQETAEQDTMERMRLIEETDDVPIPSEYYKRVTDSLLDSTDLSASPLCSWGNLKNRLLSKAGGILKIPAVREVQLAFANEREAAKKSQSINTSSASMAQQDGARPASPGTGNERKISKSSAQESVPLATASTTDIALTLTSESEDDSDDNDDSLVLIRTVGGRFISKSTTTRYLSGDPAPQSGHMALKRKRTGSGDNCGRASSKSTIRRTG